MEVNISDIMKEQGKPVKGNKPYIIYSSEEGIKKFNKAIEEYENRNKSQENLLWEKLLDDILRWNRVRDYVNQGKMIGGTTTKAQFIKELKSKYYLNLMRHAKI